MRITRTGYLFAIGLLLHASAAWSLGLGDARVESFIGQPLQMRIDLLTAPTDDLEGVTARLASADDFAMIGADRSAIGMPLTFSVREARGGQGAHILVTSRQSMSDPVLRLVVEVTWASGRLLREYTVFLDPPTVPSRAPEPAVTTAPASPQADEATAPVAEAPAPVERVAESAPAPQVITREPASEPEPESSSSQSPAAQPRSQPGTQAVSGETPDGGEYGPVQSGETLWRVASNYVGQSGLNMNQVMLAIQRKNPEAFMDDNINLLKRGATLDMPSAAEVEEISRQRAQELVAQQAAAFRMRSSLASSSTPLLAAESSPEAAPAPIYDEPASEQDSVSRLEIVPASESENLAARPGTGAVPGGEGEEEVQRDLREELARTEEELYSERQQNEYLRDRINELEAQLAEAEPEDAGFVADNEMANLEDRLQSERFEEASQAAEMTPAPVAEEEPEGNSNIPSVTTSAAADETPWYASTMVWVVMVLIVVAAVAGWLLNRRRAVEYDLSTHAEPAAPVDRLRDEAEEILRTLDSDQPSADDSDEDRVVEIAATEDALSDEGAAVLFDSADEEPEWSSDSEEGAPPRRASSRARDDADATVLDENSSDPEIKLDLARAYISMGDKEAARVILDEVLSTGSEAQQAEARSMMDEL